MTDQKGFNVLNLGEEQERTRFVDETVPAWIPVRHLLDVRAFGINAWRARSAGDIAIEEHDELDGEGHDQSEVYVVLRGSARFTVAGEVFDAGTGTIVHIEDPALKRGAVALEDDVLMLSIGNERGSFSPSEWEGRWIEKTGG